MSEERAPEMAPEPEESALDESALEVEPEREREPEPEPEPGPEPERPPRRSPHRALVRAFPDLHRILAPLLGPAERALRAGRHPAPPLGEVVRLLLEDAPLLWRGGALPAAVEGLAGVGRLQAALDARLGEVVRLLRASPRRFASAAFAEFRGHGWWAARAEAAWGGGAPGALREAARACATGPAAQAAGFLGAAAAGGLDSAGREEAARLLARYVTVGGVPFNEGGHAKCLLGIHLWILALFERGLFLADWGFSRAGFAGPAPPFFVPRWLAEARPGDGGGDGDGAPGGARHAALGGAFDRGGVAGYLLALGAATDDGVARWLAAEEEPGLAFRAVCAGAGAFGEDSWARPGADEAEARLRTLARCRGFAAARLAAAGRGGAAAALPGAEAIEGAFRAGVRVMRDALG